MTLLETLVVVFIIVAALGIALPAVQKVRAAVARVHCASNLRQLTLAVHAYGSDARQLLPQGCGYPFLRDADRLESQSSLSWQTSLLPFIEQDALWRLAWAAHQRDPSGVSNEHKAVLANTVPLFICPSDGRQTGISETGRVWGLTCYVGVAGTWVRRNDGVFHQHYPVRLADITDGTSNTLLIGERPPGPQGIYGAWYDQWGSSVCPLAQILSAGTSFWLPSEGVGCRPSDRALRPGLLTDACDVNHFWSLHPGGANFAMVDGSVRFISYGRAEVLPALATRAGGEVTEIP